MRRRHATVRDRRGRLVAALRSRRSDEQGSIILVVLLIVFLTIVATTITTQAFGQLSKSSSATGENDALQGALSGVQAAVGQIRASTDSGYVDLTTLPCGSFSGVTGTTASPAYSVSIQYYSADASGTYSPVSCVNGSGPQVTTSGTYLARAVITSCAPANSCPSSGTSSPGGVWRRVVSTYTFETTDVNVPGGLVYSYQDQECLVAVLQSPGNPGAGVQLDTTNNCAPGNPQATMEQFEYTSAWNLAIIIGNVQYCVVDPEGTASSVSLASCSGAMNDPAYQWGVNDSGDLQGVATSGTPSGQPNSYCLNNPLGGTSIPSGTTSTQAVTVITCQGGFSPKWSWQMSPSVGAGGAAASGTNLLGITDQMVNYQEFGLCLDVTNQNPTGGFNVGGGPGGYLIDYDCKQFPDYSGYPVWNQRWCFDALGTTNGNQVGLLYTPYGQTTCTGASNPYCIQSPGTTADQSSAAWVTVVPCTLNQSQSAYAPALVWTAWSANGGKVNDYTWTDWNGNCLETNPNNAQDPGGGTSWSTIQVAACSGSYAQKWNAPATLGTSQLSNTHEGTTAGWITGNP